MIALQTKNMRKKFNNNMALKNLSLAFEKGKITGIIGPNGSGKTTLLNLLSGLLVGDKGSIIINNSTDLNSLKPHQAYDYKITRTFQVVRLFDQLTVLDNILINQTKRNTFAALIEVNNKRYINKTYKVLKTVKLWDKKDELAENLSYGQRKLLEIARSVCSDSEIYLLDEPFAGLFPAMIKTIISFIKQLRKEGKTVILIDHNIDIIHKLCDFIFVLDNGRLIDQGNPRVILKNKKVIKSYLGR